MDIQNIADCPTLPAVKNRQQLERALKTDNDVIFLLFGDLLSIAELTECVHRAGKHAIVHLDLIGGLGSREVAVDFIARTTKADGIISTKPSLIRRAKELGLFTVLRVFLIDSMALDNLGHAFEQVVPDTLEILPGLMPGIIRRLTATVPVPIIAGGLISEKSHIVSALSAGAIAVSTTNEALWDS